MNIIDTLYNIGIYMSKIKGNICYIFFEVTKRKQCLI